MSARPGTREAIGLLQDMTPVYEDVAEYMTEKTRQRFISGKAPDGTAWARKSEATLARYKRLGYGNLSKPLIGPLKALSRQIVTFVSKDGVVIGSSQIYARVMQEGAVKGAFGTDSRGRPVPWGRIPAREWLGISPSEGTDIVEIVEEHLGRKLNV